MEVGAATCWRAGRRRLSKIPFIADTSVSERVHLINVRLRDRPERLPVLALSDTDLFPLLRGLVSAHEYDAMAEDFEKKEHQLFGEDGFEKMAHRVASLEQAIGINDLAQFTPR
jgi:hypothetical protein